MYTTSLMRECFIILSEYYCTSTWSLYFSASFPETNCFVGVVLLGCAGVKGPGVKGPGLDLSQAAQAHLLLMAYRGGLPVFFRALITHSRTFNILESGCHEKMKPLVPESGVSRLQAADSH
jgi:hypothetical protein